MTINEKAAYIKGLAEGLALDASKPETKVMNAIIELLEDITEAVEKNKEDIDNLGELAEELDEDLGDLEEVVYGNDEDYNPDDDDIYDEDDDDGEDEDLRCISCANCGEEICFDESIDPEDLTCPNCGKSVTRKEDR